MHRIVALGISHSPAHRKAARPNAARSHGTIRERPTRDTSIRACDRRPSLAQPGAFHWVVDAVVSCERVHLESRRSVRAPRLALAQMALLGCARVRNRRRVANVRDENAPALEHAHGDGSPSALVALHRRILLLLLVRVVHVHPCVVQRREGDTQRDGNATAPPLGVVFTPAFECAFECGSEHACGERSASRSVVPVTHDCGGPSGVIRRLVPRVPVLTFRRFHGTDAHVQPVV
mmetsp:Transcript_5291/g.12120  ORF Transcript_5291/g.12120 Transcript_5291/m.12120 type:complete len:234 (+) Transcript_5291:1634-2335(+)